MRRHPLLTAIGLLLVAACSGNGAGDTSAAGTSPEAPTAEVELSGFQFQPDAITVAAGTTVTFVNRDNVGHTVTAGVPDAPTGEFDQSLGGTDATAEIAFDTPGEYALFCNIHQDMRGVVTVTG